jgi:hypothetical protein
MTKTCNRCGATGLTWKQSKKGNWYLATESMWQGDMGGIRVYYPAHACKTQEIEIDADAKNSAMFDAGYVGII